MSSIVRIPPPTVNGIITCSAVRRTTSIMMSRFSWLAVMSRKTSSSAPSCSYRAATCTGSPASRRLTKLVPLTTRPWSTSRHGITRLASMGGETHRRRQRTEYRKGTLPACHRLLLSSQAGQNSTVSSRLRRVEGLPHLPPNHSTLRDHSPPWSLTPLQPDRQLGTRLDGLTQSKGSPTHDPTTTRISRLRCTRTPKITAARCAPIWRIHPGDCRATGSSPQQRTPYSPAQS